MKKKLIALVSLIMSLMIGLCGLGGCKLITKDTDKDMQQVVATISIDKGVKDSVYKQDLIVDYLNYGYYYVQYNGYTQARTFELILQNQINTRILVQNAIKQLEEDADYQKDSQYAKWDARRYLDSDQMIEATYNTYKIFNDLLDQFEETDVKDKLSDAYDQQVRTVPKDAKKAEEELDSTKMQEYIDKGFDLSSTAKRREAFNRLINFLKVNNLLGEDYKNNDLTTTEYYKRNIKLERENILVETYRDLQTLKLRKQYTFADLENAFKAELEDQKGWSNAEFVEALSNASVKEPVLYGVNGTYGYVYNLLLGVDEIQSERIKAIDETLSNAEREQARNDILKTTRVKDLRSSWIISGYDFDGKNFTGDYTFAKLAKNSLEFKGDVILLNPSENDATKPVEGEDAQYNAVSTIYGLDEFIACMNAYMTGGEFDKTQPQNVTDNKGDYSGNSVYSAGTYNGNVEEYTAKINELLFAFSTDSGSLNTYKGYVIKPEVDGANSEEYVETFATAGRELIAKGGNSYVIVASDYGYHVMFFSEKFTAEKTVADNLIDYMNAEFDLPEGITTWQNYFDNMVKDFGEWEDTNNYMYLLLDAISSSKITNQINRLERDVVNEYLYEKDNAVVIFEKAYSDLLK